jgi:quinol---cytochrome c reductase iron-sulfur subunit, bacillus type
VAEVTAGSDRDVEKRRSFLGALLAMGTATVGAILSIPLARLTLDPLWRTTTQTLWSDAGPAKDFAAITAPTKVQITIEQRDGWRKVLSEKAIYVVKGSDARPRVLSAVCPHLGCSIGWNEDRRQFVCPCHNGTFAPDGTLLAGPPPRGMDELDAMVEDGRLKVRYQYFRQLVPTKEVIA